MKRKKSFKPSLSLLLQNSSNDLNLIIIFLRQSQTLLSRHNKAIEPRDNKNVLEFFFHKKYCIHEFILFITLTRITGKLNHASDNFYHRIFPVGCNKR